MHESIVRPSFLNAEEIRFFPSPAADVSTSHFTMMETKPPLPDAAERRRESVRHNDGSTDAAPMPTPVHCFHDTYRQ